MQWSFRKGDRVRVSGRASVTTPVVLYARVRYEDGGLDRVEVICTHAGDRSNILFRSPDPFEQNGYFEALTVDTGIINRSEYYMMVSTEFDRFHYPIFAGWLGVIHTPLGFFERHISGQYWNWPVWVYRASVAQANGAGGAIVLDFPPAVDDTMIITQAYAINSGTNALEMRRTDEDNNQNILYLSVASAATVEATIPRTFSETGDSGFHDSTDPMTRLYRGDDIFTIQQTGAGAQNDTLIVALRAFLSSFTIPTVSKARSTNSADVTITPTVNKIA